MALAPRRPKWRAYLLLSRLSNLPTVWTNVLAGTVASGALVGGASVARVGIAVSLLYTAGMFLNDAFDAVFDAVHRRDRPLPAGEVTRPEAFGIGFALLAGGVLLLAAESVVWGVALASGIVLYDYRHKRDRLGPLIMGICRGLVYCVAADAAAADVSATVLAWAVGLTAYVVALTWVAKQAGPRAGTVVALLIAGISLFDAAVVALYGGSGALVLLAAAGFPLTLVLQRFVPGT